MKRQRYAPDVRKDLLLQTACRLAEQGTPYYKLTREQIARAAGVTGTAVQYHFGTMPKLRRDIMRHAIAGKVLAVVAQGLSVDDPHARKAPPDVRAAAAARLLR